MTIGKIRNKQTGATLSVIDFERAGEKWFYAGFEGDDYGARSWDDSCWEFIPELPTETKLPEGTIVQGAKHGQFLYRRTGEHWKSMSDTGSRIICDEDMAVYLSESGDTFSNYYKVIYQP